MSSKNKLKDRNYLRWSSLWVQTMLSVRLETLVAYILREKTLPKRTCIHNNFQFYILEYVPIVLRMNFAFQLPLNKNPN